MIEKPITKSDSETQTDTHILEPNIVKSYEWNEWELRRKAIKLVRPQLSKFFFSEIELFSTLFNKRKSLINNLVSIVGKPANQSNSFNADSTEQHEKRKCYTDMATEVSE